MIADTLKNIGVYFVVNPYIKRAAEYIEAFQKQPVADGRYPLDGDRFFVIVQRYTTSSRQGKHFEAHRQYIDLQAVLEGSETIGWAPLEELSQISEEFSKGGDIAFYDGEERMAIGLREGWFTLLFPGDAHIPCVAYERPAEVLKLVFKIRIDDYKTPSCFKAI